MCIKGSFWKEGCPKGGVVGMVIGCVSYICKFMNSPTTSPYGDSSFRKEEN